MGLYTDHATRKLSPVMFAVEEDGTVERVLIMLLIFAVSLLGTSCTPPLREVVVTQQQLSLSLP